MKIYEYIGGENSQKIQYGTPFLVIGFCDGEWELSQTTWYDVKHNTPAIVDLMDSLMVTMNVSPELFEKYFRFSCEIQN